MRSRSCVFMLALILHTGIVIASSTPDATIARDVQEALNRAVSADGPGIAVLVAKGEHVIFRGARGRADIELAVPLTPDHVFRIASVTKTFTAAMILKLAETGKLSLDDTLNLYIADFPNADRITIRELLSHTSGISDIVKDPQPGFSRRDVDLATLIDEIRKRPLDFPPGTAWRYSNAGFILLGAVIERVTGNPWHVALHKQVLEPLGLKHTQYSVNSLVIPGRVAGYTTDENTHVISNAAFISASIPASAGALASTLDDLASWMHALTTGKVISKESFQQMITPPANITGTSTAYRYGFGMYLWHVRGATMIGHTGQINGFASMVASLPEQDITVVVLANDDTFDARTMGRRLAAIALGKPYSDTMAVQPSADELQALAGTYQFNETSVETLSVKDNKLYAQHGKAHMTALQMNAARQLHFIPDEITYFVPVRDQAGKIMRLDYFENGDDPPIPLPRVQPSSN